MSYIGTNKVGKMYLGSTAIGKAYLGNDLVYDSAGGSVTPVLPDGYAQLDYVQGITRVISTNISPVNSQWEFDVVCDSSTTSNEVIICTGFGYGGQFAAACGNGKWGLGTGAGYYTSVNVTTRSTIFITYTSNGITMTIGNETVSRTGTNGHTDNPFLFGAKGNGLFSSGKIYSVKCLSGGSFNGVPAQRISDNKNGIYDLANDVFYPLT